jgi:hypothetical protein
MVGAPTEGAQAVELMKVYQFDTRRADSVLQFLSLKTSDVTGRFVSGAEEHVMSRHLDKQVTAGLHDRRNVRKEYLRFALPLKTIEDNGGIDWIDVTRRVNREVRDQGLHVCQVTKASTQGLDMDRIRISHDQLSS